MAVSVEWIDGDVPIPKLLGAAPQIRPVLDRSGLKGGGGARGPAESRAFFAHAHDVPLGRLLAQLREAARPIPEVVITGSDYVDEVLERYPVLLNTFLAFGIQLLSNPLLRRMMARHVTLAAACRHIDVDLETFLAALNDARKRHAASPTAARHCCNSYAGRDNHV